MLAQRWAAISWVLLWGGAGCIEPPPYPKILPASDTVSDTVSDAVSDASPPSCGVAADCPAPSPCQSPATCESGAGCVYVALSCDDGIECTDDLCLPESGCIHDVSGCACTKDADCDDGDPCTTAATCQSLSCSGGLPVDCSALDAPCYQATCDSKDGTCSAVAQPDGAPCDDGSEGTSDDACLAAVCAGIANGCNDKNSCTVDSLETATGKCLHAALPDLTLCDDTDPCTIADTCNDGQCIAMPRAELQVVWQVALDPRQMESGMYSAATQSGGATAATYMGAPATIYHAGGALPVSGTVMWPDGVERDAVWILRINKLGVLTEYERISSKGDSYLLDAAFSRAGDTFLLISQDGEMYVPGGAAVTLPGPAAGRTNTLIYMPHAGGFGWVLSFPDALTPLAPFYIEGAQPRIGLLTKHTEAVTPPTVGGSPANPLPAATAGTVALTMLTWNTGGADLVATGIGQLGTGAENSGVSTQAGGDGTVAVLVQAEGPASLGAPPGPESNLTDGVGALAGVFNSAGVSLTVVQVAGPTAASAEFLAYDFDFGLVLPLRFDGSVSVTQSAIPIETVSDPLSGDFLSVLLGRTVAGESLWSAKIALSDPLFASISFVGDGDAQLVGRGKGLSMPSGAEFAFFAPAQVGAKPVNYVARMDSQGVAKSLALQPVYGVCVLATGSEDGSLLCKGVGNKFSTPDLGEGVEILSRVVTPPPAGCGPSQ